MKRTSVILTLLALLIVFPIFAQAGPVAKFTSIEGNVDVTPPGKDAVKANPGDPLNVGDIIRTKSKAKCEITFTDGSILRLAENSRLRVTEFSHEKEKRSAIIDLFRGKVQNIVQAVAGQSKYEVHTPTAVCGVRGTQFYTYYQSGVSGAVVTEGTVYAYSSNKPGEVRTIGAGQAMVVTNANTPPAVKTATTKEMEQHQKDTKPAEKKKEESKKEEEKKPEAVAAKAEEGKKEEGKKEEQKPEAKTEEKPAETKAADKPAEETSKTAGAATPSPAADKPTEEAPKIVVAAASAAQKEQSAVVDIISASVTAAPPVPSTPQTTVTTTPVTTIPTTPIVPPQSDTTAPTITVTATPDKLTNASAATFRFKTDEKAAIKFRVDAGSWVEDTVYDTEFVVNLQTLSEKAHTFEVEAKDQAGNSSSTSYSWTTDYTGPTITLSGTPAAVTNAKTATIVVSASKQATYTYMLNGATVASPILTNLPEGSNTFTVTATDAAGNTAIQTYAWTTDYTAPNITLTPQAAPALNGKTDVKVVLAGGDNVKFSSLLDGTTSLSGASLDLKDLAPGAHTLEVKATDEAGNESSKSISFSLDRYALAGKFSGSVGNVSGTAAGEVAAVSGQNWGGWNLEMKGSGDATPNASWSLYAGGKNADGSYWLDVAPGTTDSAAKSLTGKSQLTYLSRDYLGFGAGSVAGQYDGLGAYSLTDVGAGSYTQKPLTFLSDLSAGRTAGLSATTQSHKGTYLYSDGRSSSYQGYEQGQFLGGLYFPDDAMIFLKRTQTKAAGLYYIGSKTYVFDPVMRQRSRTAYYVDPQDGSGVTVTRTESWDSKIGQWISTTAMTSGTWDASQPFETIITPPPAAGYYSGPNDVTSAAGSVEKGFTGLLGGSDSLWGATDLAPTGVTLMGSYDVPISEPGQIWGTRIESRNDLKANSSTYDGGAFSGYLAGSDTVSSASPGLRNMSGMAEALYIDPSGNAGYLRGSLTGYGYPGIGMLLMNGNLGKKEMKTGIGILPENLFASLWSFDHEKDDLNTANYKSSLFTGDFNGAGKIGSVYSVLDTLSIVNYDTHDIQPWGIYKQYLAGTFENPAAASSWSGMDGGRGVFGPYKAYKQTLGGYAYPDGGYYSYEYNDINEGNAEYYHKVGSVNTLETIKYYASGVKITCSDGTCVTGAWTPSTTSLASILETPPDTGYVSSTKQGPQSAGPGDTGYWLAKVTGSNGSDNTLSGTLSGRFITPTKMGEITGNMLGTYDSSINTWQARSLGEYSGTPLTFMSNVSFDERKTTLARAGAYNYNGGYYSYIYDIDNKYGNMTYQQSGSIAYPRTSITYNGDGTTLTEIYNSTGKLTSSITGKWDPATSLATLLVTPAQVAGQTTTVLTPEYTKSRLRGAGSMSGIMGGTESLWYGTDGATISATKSDIPVTMIGSNNISGNYGANAGGNIWHTSTGSVPISSYNYIQGTSTTYEGGSYQGSMGGYELPSTVSGERDLGGRLNALYIDPAGNAGYLEGILTGKAYPGTKMFEMDGALTRTQVETAAEMGVTAASDLTYNWGSLYAVNFNGIFKDGTTTVGAVKGYLNTGSSLTLFNAKSDLSVNWGRYGLVLYGSYDTAAANWEAKMGGQGSFGAYKRSGDTYISSSAGYWLADVDGAWTSDRFTSTLWGRFLSQTLMGEMDGTLGGTYDSTTKTWEATSGGKWSGAPLKYGNYFNSNRQNGILSATSGNFNYSGGGSYWYNYNNDNSWGQKGFRPTSGSLPVTYTNYNGDGTTRTEAYDASGALTITTGTWDKTTSLSTLVTTPPAPAAGETGTWVPQYAQYYYLNSLGSLNGNMGGTESLWYGADGATILLTKNDIPVTVMGQYSGTRPAAGNLWYNSSFSEGKIPVYDGGSYQGLMAGVELPSSAGTTRDLEGSIAALYIDPAGNAGYLRGDLSGKAYPGVVMFEMDGTLNRTQVATAADVGVSAADLTNNAYWGSINADGVGGMFIDGATITGAITGKSYGSNTISIFNKTNTLFQRWGIYGLEFSGAYDTAKPIWEAKTGGRGAFGVGRIITDSIVPDEGYWLADMNGSWADGKITGAVGGRFITNRKLGDISGDLIGLYNTADSTWQAVSLGTWGGTQLKFGNNFNSGRQNGLLPATNGNYSYSGGGNYWYNYNDDNSWGQKGFRPTSASLPITFTNYNGDGTTRTEAYDASGILTITTGTWDKTTSLSTLMTTPPAPAAGETGTWALNGIYSYFNSIGSLNGSMGGTESLWYGADGATILLTKNDIPVTVMGQYSGTGPATGNLWYSSGFSERGTPTYDGGRYQGIMGGIEVPSSAGTTRDLEGKVAALYIDPAGNAGYLRGGLVGKVYPGVTMFEMDGTLNRTQVATAAEVGVSAANLTTSTYWAGINADYGVSGTFSDGTTDTGAITATSYPANNTLSIYNKASNLFQGWGIYGLGFSGAYNTDKPAWEARMGGRGGFGVGEIKNDYIFADDGYWLADVSGNWADGKLTGAVAGKFITKRKMGEISGDLFGVYKSSGLTWQAASLGTWEGTPLAFNGSSNYSTSWQYQYAGAATGDSLTTGGILSNSGPQGFGWMGGLIGGTDTLFGTYDSALQTYAAVTAAGIGSSDKTQGLPLFLTRFDGSDVKDATLVNGYALLFGGFKSAASLSLAGGMQGLYWKKNPTTGNYEIGVLSGNNGVTANIYALSNNRMWELASGTTLQAYNFLDGMISATAPVIYNRTIGSLTTPVNVAAEVTPGSGTTSWQLWSRVKNIASFNDPSLSAIVDSSRLDIGAEVTGGGYSGTPTSGDKFNFVLGGGNRYNATEITAVNGNVFDAKTVAARMVMTDTVDSGYTTVEGGVLKGSFDPTTATWRAIALTTGMETKAFLDKLNSFPSNSSSGDAQRAAFYAATKIPAFTVGTTDLRGTSTYVTGGANIYLGSAADATQGIRNATFLAPSTGGNPQLWASGDVRGSYSAYTGTPVGTSVPLTGYQPGTTTANGITATLGITNWGTANNKWGATVTNGTVPAGTAGFTYPNAATTGIGFKGGAAGSFTPGTTSGTFSGTAAGIVK